MRAVASRRLAAGPLLRRILNLGTQIPDILRAIVERMPAKAATPRSTIALRPSRPP